VTIGKPIGNGHPIACVVTTPEIAESFEKIGTEYFNTYGGNPVSLAIANAVLDVIENEKLRENALIVGNIMKKGLNDLKAQYPIIGDVRGEAFFLGVDLVVSRDTKEPASLLAEYIISKFKDEKILMSTDGKYGNVLKFKPPMVFSIKNAEHFLQTFEDILQEIYTEEYRLGSLSRCSFSSYESLNSLSESLSTNSDEEPSFESSNSN